MLILSRRIGETLHIGDAITVTVVAVHGDQVRIGVQAPREVPVYRGEVYARIEQARDQAAGLWPCPTDAPGVRPPPRTHSPSPLGDERSILADER